MSHNCKLQPARLSISAGTPTSTQFSDIYFSANDGVGESRYHFLDGNHLSQRFAELQQTDFFIAETGFGTGLNALLAIDLWRQHIVGNHHLHYISTEKHPIPPDTLSIIYKDNGWQNDVTQALLQHYPPMQTGQYTIALADNITLTLLLGDAGEQLSRYDFLADAWFLDGFAPSRNPDMWSPTLFDNMRKHSCQGSTFATFTAAGFVRRGLQAAGFAVDKTPGFAGKRERLIGHFIGQPTA